MPGAAVIDPSSSTGGSTHGTSEGDAVVGPPGAGARSAAMEANTRALAAIDEHHWMYRNRRAMIDEALATLALDPASTPHVLDVGCGPGGTTKHLAQVGPVTAIDPSPAAASFVLERIPTARFLLGAIDDLDELLGDARFGLVACFGALNHLSVADPRSAVRSLADRVAPGGGLLLEEPADQRLHRHMDVVSDTVRRFDLEDLRAATTDAGLQLVQSRYVHAWAWPVAWALARRERHRPPAPDRPPAELAIDSFARTATLLDRAERRLARTRLRLPVGTGCWVVARRPAVEGPTRTRAPGAPRPGSSAPGSAPSESPR